MIRLTLPWPPALNHLYATFRGRRILSRDGRAYHQRIAVMLRGKRPTMTERLRVVIEAFPPDRRRRDIDGVCKALLDSLTKAGVWTDDSLIDDLRILRRDVVKGGSILLSAEPIPLPDVPAECR